MLIFAVLVYAMTQLVGQTLTAICYSSMALGYFLQSAGVAALSQTLFSYLTNVLCFGGPVCLFITRQGVDIELII